jgi:hypothetical protein
MGNSTSLDDINGKIMSENGNINLKCKGIKQHITEMFITFEPKKEFKCSNFCLKLNIKNRGRYFEINNIEPTFFVSNGKEYYQYIHLIDHHKIITRCDEFGNLYEIVYKFNPRLK